MRYLTLYCPNGAMTPEEWAEYAGAMYARFGLVCLRTELPIQYMMVKP